MQLVFASGFLFPQRLFGVAYFRGLREHFAASPHRAIFPAVPVAGTAQLRAAALAGTIVAAFPDGPIHIVAHSMAGLDCRAMVGANLLGLGEPGRIAALTTLATPHRGSPVADALAGPRATGVRRQFHDAVVQVVGRLGIATGAIGDLTSQAASALPDIARSHPHIRVRSHAGIGRSTGLPTCLAMAQSHRAILEETGEPNDGLVTLGSARYGEFQEPPWPCDHADMVGHNLDTADLGLFRFDHVAAVDGIIGQFVADQGA